MSDGNAGANRLGKAIQAACEAACDEPLDDRPTFAEIVGTLDFHKHVWLEVWREAIEEAGE